MAGLLSGVTRTAGGRDVRTQMWIMAGGLLIGWCLSNGLHPVRAEDGRVTDDGWRPKGHYRQAAGTGQAEAFTAPSRPTVVLRQPSEAGGATEPFDWRDDLYRPSQTANPVTRAKTGAPSAQADSFVTTAATASRWCRCEHSSICGHCGLRRPILADYHDTPKPTAEQRTMLVDTEQRLPAIDRLRLALDQVNDKVQQTLGQF